MDIIRFEHINFYTVIIDIASSRAIVSEQNVLFTLYLEIHRATTFTFTFMCIRTNRAPCTIPYSILNFEMMNNLLITQLNVLVIYIKS